jgi:hypothetical protein
LRPRVHVGRGIPHFKGPRTHLQYSMLFLRINVSNITSSKMYYLLVPACILSDYFVGFPQAKSKITKSNKATLLQKWSSPSCLILHSALLRLTQKNIYVQV